MGLINGPKSQILNHKKFVFCKFSHKIKLQAIIHWYIHFANLQVCFAGRVGIFFFTNGNANRFWHRSSDMKIIDNKFLHGKFGREDEGQWQHENLHLTCFNSLSSIGHDFKLQHLIIMLIWRQSSRSVQISPGQYLHKLRRFLANFANFPGKLT